MNAVAKEIKEYWDRQSQHFSWDAETLDFVSQTLSKDEQDVLLKGRAWCHADGGELWDEYLFAVTKAFNRHNDIICHYTTVDDDGSIIISKRSSITELGIKVSTLVNCNRNGVYHIGDIEKTQLPRLTLESIANVTAAIIVYNREHGEGE